MPEPLPMRPAASVPPPVEDEVPVVDTEVPPAVLEQIRARAAAAVDHDGPRTLPPFAPPHDTVTANDPLFASAAPSAARPSRLVWAVAALTLVGGLIGSLLWRGDEATPVNAKDARAPAVPAAAPVKRAEVDPPPVTPPPAAAVAAPQPVAVAPVVEPPAQAVPPPVKTARSKPVERVAPRAPTRSVAVLRQDPVPESPPRPEQPPPPVKAACTPQVAALALCTLDR
ncbi:hypothetical protein [Piscinibacter sp. XHJ-5]|uniref:hypothetical protein n=1 Tax=Piscinibacter sp. XHJ-5 TaxID=3037797 RepID=UPI002452A60B|nr:hypothetical protein [Piscinibacter sp. XHJ-5]